MNKNIAKPLIIQFTPPETEPVIKKSQKSLFVPVNTKWVTFRDNILPLVENDTYDSVMVHALDNINRDVKGVVGNMAVKMNALSGAGTKADKPVLAYDAADKPFYLMNPSWKDMKDASLYAPSDETVMGKYNEFESDAKWQGHQDKIWNRMKDMMPLSKKSDKFDRDHAAQLKDPKRGLEDKDLEKFWSFKPKKSLAPTIMGDDMVGMPSVEGREYDGFTMSNIQPDGSVATKPITVRSLMTIGAAGIMIPMANADGNVNKHQIMADMTAYGTVLHFRAQDGKTVAKGQVFDKKTREYKFTFMDGNSTGLKVTDVSADGTVTMQDSRGLFNIKPKTEIIDILKDRGYEVPEIITSVKAEQNGKYMWQSPGTMTGSEEVLKTVSPSNPGYIIARPPKNGANDYVVLVAEGALKGHIVAKYVDVKDKDGICFGDKIAGDRGLIVTQVPGVSEAYIKNALTIYDKYDIKGTYIAMDADGRENRNVALGIHNAYNYINKVNPATVLSWDPSQKGMDDALLAVAQGKITIKEMGIISGTPDTLFPLENAKPMTPYTLEGKRMNQPAWQTEYEESKATRMAKMSAAQTQTAERQKTKEIVTQNEAKKPKEQNAAMQDLEAVNQAAATQEPKKEQWVQTPQDISNIQSVTVTKAAEMADAMNGIMRQPKQEPRPEMSPDVDEMPEGKPIRQKEQSMAEAAVMQKIMDAATAEARKWDTKNPPMTPAATPNGCKSSYKYQQPVISTQSFDASRLPGNVDYQQEEGWGIATVLVDHVMAVQEKGLRQEQLKSSGLSIIGNMRLVEQTLTLDKELAPSKDLGSGLEQ